MIAGYVILSLTKTNKQTKKEESKMAKAKRLYSGSDSYGRSIEVAESVDGLWFWRDYGWNGYGMSWSKWQEREAPTHPTKVKCYFELADSPEYIDVPERERENMIEWGFHCFKIVAGPHRVRLPNK